MITLTLMITLTIDVVRRCSTAEKSSELRNQYVTELVITRLAHTLLDASLRIRRTVTINHNPIRGTTHRARHHRSPANANSCSSRSTGCDRAYGAVSAISVSNVVFSRFTAGVFALGIGLHIISLRSRSCYLFMQDGHTTTSVLSPS